MRTNEYLRITRFTVSCTEYHNAIFDGLNWIVRIGYDGDRNVVLFDEDRDRNILWCCVVRARVGKTQTKNEIRKYEPFSWPAQEKVIIISRATWKRSGRADGGFVFQNGAVKKRDNGDGTGRPRDVYTGKAVCGSGRARETRVNNA